MVTRKKPAADVAPFDGGKPVSKTPPPAAKKVVAPKSKPAGTATPIASSDKEKVPLGPPPKGVLVPKTLGAAADMYDKYRKAQAEKKKEMDVEEEKAKWVKAWLLENMPKQGQNVAGGKLAKVEIKNKEVPRVDDWAKVYARVVKDYLAAVKKKNGQEDGAFALLQRRLGESTVKELWDNGVTLDGVSKFKYLDLSVGKI